MSQSKWATIKGRKAFEDFPCVEFGTCVTEKCVWVSICRQRRIYDEYMRLRDVVEAVLKDDSVERLATYWRTHATLWSDVPSVFDKADSRAKAWEALEETDESLG